MRIDDMFFESSDELVVRLQNLLNSKGANLKVNGVLDKETIDAVRKYYPEYAHKQHFGGTGGKDSGGVMPSKSLSTSGDAKKDLTPSSKTSTDKSSSFKDKTFASKLKTVAYNLKIDPDDLAAVIYFESRGRPDASNKFKVSAGLIGFTEKTAQSLGTTKDEIRTMSAVDQLDLVEKFYKRAGLKPGMTREQIYMLTFMPAFVNSPNSTVLGKENGGNLVLPNGRETRLSMDKIWYQNPAFGRSFNKNFFTVGDVKRAIMNVSVPSLAENISEDDVNPVDTVELDVPLLLRMMEYAREDAKTDMDLHDVTEKMIHLSKTGETLSMAQYDDIVGDSDEPIQEPTPEQPAQQEAIGGASAEEFLKSVEYKPRHPAKPKRSLMGKPMREGHGRYWCSTDKRWKERQGPKQSRG